MQLAQLIAGLPDKVAVEPLPGLDDAWTLTWAGFRHGIAASANPEFAFQVNAKDTVPVDYLHAVLSTARANSGTLLAAAPMAKVDGVTLPGATFTSLISVLPSVARRLEAWSSELSAVTYAVVGGWPCEVSGDEDESEARFRLKKALKVNVDREPVPFMRLAYSDGHGGGTVGDSRGVLLPDFLYTFLSRPHDSGFAEFENHRHEVRRIEFTPDGPVRVDGDVRVPVETERLADDARSFLLGEASA